MARYRLTPALVSGKRPSTGKRKTTYPARLGALALVGGLLAGCAGQTTTSPNHQTTTSTNQLTQPVPKSKITLTVWSFMPGEEKGGPAAYARVVKAFETKYPQVKVKMNNLPYGTYFQTVRNATVARKGPDVVTMYGGAQAYSYRHGLLPLQHALEPDVAKTLKFVTDSFSKNGNLYVIPTGAYGYTLAVNPKFFTEVGLDPSTAISTWSGLLHTCKVMHAHGIVPISTGWKDGYEFETLMYMISSQMMDAATLKKWIHGTIRVDSPMFVTATGYIDDMNHAGCFGRQSLALNMYDDAYNNFYAHKAAMMVAGSYQDTQTALHSIPDLLVARLPQVPDSRYKSLIDAGPDTGWSVTRWTSHPQAAGAFVNFMASRQAQMILWKGVSEPPNLKGMTVQAPNAVGQSYLDLINNPVNHTGFMAFPLTVLAVFERNAEPLISGSMSIRTFLEQAQTAFSESG